jgi:pimeloyl-ACP methyl ester carboxylesterase
MEFELIWRGHKRFLLLIPGWGFCYDIFSRLNLPYNYILPKKPVYGNISGDVHNFLLSKSIAKVNILGWSLGAYVACDFKIRYPGMIDILHLVSMRRAFNKTEIKISLDDMEADPVAGLKQFYRRCFFRQRADYYWFSDNLEESNIKQWKVTELKEGLFYLAGKKADLFKCADAQIHIYHGENDIIAPLSEIPVLPRGIDIDIIPNTGHLPFLSFEFERRFRVS